MQRFKVYKTDYNGRIPKIKSIYNGYRGLNRGLAILWNNKLIPIILPVNERKCANGQ